MESSERICDYCGVLTDEEYSDEEWDTRGHQCEECDEELIILDKI